MKGNEGRLHALFFNGHTTISKHNSQTIRQATLSEGSELPLTP